MKIIACALAAALMVGSALAQTSPQAPVRIVLPYAAGGSSDFLARNFAEKFRAHIGAAAIVDNRPGANGVIAVQAVSKAATDGSVLFLTAGSSLVINPHIYRNLAYNPTTDLTPIARIAVSASVLAVRSTIPASTMQELFAWSNANAKEIRLGSSGIGSIGHLWAEQFRSATKLNVLHVPYNGVAPIVVNILGGQIDGTIVDVAGIAPQVSSGKMKIIGLVGPARNSGVPTIPTLAEQGYPGVDGLSWYGVLGPANMPPETVRRVSEAIAKTLAEKEFSDKLLSVGMVPAFQSPDEFSNTIRSETAWWARLIAEKKIKADD